MEIKTDLQFVAKLRPNGEVDVDATMARARELWALKLKHLEEFINLFKHYES